MEERDVLEEKMRRADERGMEESGKHESSEEAIACLGDRRWPHADEKISFMYCMAKA